MTATTIPEVFRIGEVARQVGVTIETLRRWERTHLIPPATRRRGHRIYTPADIEGIRQITFTRPDTPAERRE